MAPGRSGLHGTRQRVRELPSTGKARVAEGPSWSGAFMPLSLVAFGPASRVNYPRACLLVCVCVRACTSVCICAQVCGGAGLGSWASPRLGSRAPPKPLCAPGPLGKVISVPSPSRPPPWSPPVDCQGGDPQAGNPG